MAIQYRSSGIPGRTAETGSGFERLCQEGTRALVKGRLLACGTRYTSIETGLWYRGALESESSLWIGFGLQGLPHSTHSRQVWEQQLERPNPGERGSRVVAKRPLSVDSTGKIVMNFPCPVQPV